MIKKRFRVTIGNDSRNCSTRGLLTFDHHFHFSGNDGDEWKVHSSYFIRIENHQDMVLTFGQPGRIGRDNTILIQIDKTIVIGCVQNNQCFDTMGLKIEYVDACTDLFTETNDRWNLHFDEELPCAFIDVWYIDHTEAGQTTDSNGRDHPGRNDVWHSSTKLHTTVRIGELLMPHEVEL